MYNNWYGRYGRSKMAQNSIIKNFRAHLPKIGSSKKFFVVIFEISKKSKFGEGQFSLSHSELSIVEN